MGSDRSNRAQKWSKWLKNGSEMVKMSTHFKMVKMGTHFKTVKMVKMDKNG